MAPVIIQHCCDPNWPLSTALAKCVDPIFCGSLVFGHCLCVRHYKSPSAAAEVAFLHPNQVSYPQALEQLQWRSRARFNLSAPETNSPSLYPQKIRWSKLVKKRSFGLRPATKYDAAIRLVEKSLNETEVLTENHVWMDDFHCRHCHVWLQRVQKMIHHCQSVSSGLCGYADDVCPRSWRHAREFGRDERQPSLRGVWKMAEVLWQYVLCWNQQFEDVSVVLNCSFLLMMILKWPTICFKRALNHQKVHLSQDMPILDHMHMCHGQKVE